ncbi:MAG: MmgE/PrpD family protein, partial [Betaproteobacteria bacterium]|nr:MmgE/PrpD family protein [Betaproteobacteria bacterium]
FTWDRVRDQTIQALAKKVFVREDPALTAMLPQLRPARVTIHLRDGRELKGAADSNRGDDQDPYSREELCAKFSELTERAWSREAAQDLLEKLQRLDELRDVNLLLS